MNKLKGRAAETIRLFLAVGLLAAGVPWSKAQDQAAQTPAPQQTQQQPAQPQDQKQSGQSAAPAPEQTPQSNPAQPTPEPPKEEIKITPRQAEELFHSVDEILEFDSKFTGLPIKHEIKRRLTGRDEVVSFLKQSSEEDTQRLKRSELVLKKFGLLPRNFDLETFLVS